MLYKGQNATGKASNISKELGNYSLSWERDIAMRESFKQERAPCMNQAKMFLLQLIHNTMEVLAKLETKSVFL